MTPPLALTLRGYAQTAPELWREDLAAAADAVEENATLLDERDAARAEIDAMIATLPQNYYMDPPDGGSVEPVEQMRRMATDARRYRWLRGDAPARSERWPRWTVQRWDGRCWNSLDRANLDAAIDAALKEGGE